MIQVGDEVTIHCDPHRPAVGRVLQIDDASALVECDYSYLVVCPLTCLEAL